jgi:hypothetical protein
MIKVRFIWKMKQFSIEQFKSNTNSKTMFLNVFFLLGVLAQIFAFSQEIEFFSEPHSDGTSVKFKEKLPTLNEWEFFVNKANSYCSLGR